MPSPARHCAVTGATGYVGSRISEYFATHGWTVFELGRRPSPHPAPGSVHVPFHLGPPVDPSVFRDHDIRVVIHCAYDFQPIKWEGIHRVNVEGSARLLRAVREGGVEKIIFLSSISAFNGCSSLYGKAKMEIEKVASDVGAAVIRSGLVYGSGPSGGMFGSLQRMVAKSAIIPLIGSGRYMQYLIHQEDLCKLLFGIGCGENTLPPVPVVAASPHGWQIRQLLQILAVPQHPRLTFISVPWRMIWLGLKTLELLGIAAPFRSDSVISLVRQNPAPDFMSTDQLGFRLREFQGEHSAMSE
jgi:hypothetical protein